MPLSGFEPRAPGPRFTPHTTELRDSPPPPPPAGGWPGNRRRLAGQPPPQGGRSSRAVIGKIPLISDTAVVRQSGIGCRGDTKHTDLGSQILHRFASGTPAIPSRQLLV